MLGVKMQRTSAYHPQANGMIERLHRQLKNFLKARTTDPYWMDHLPMVAYSWVYEQHGVKILIVPHQN